MAETGFGTRNQAEALALAFWSPSAAIDKAVSVRSPWLMQSVLVALQLTLTVAAYRFVAEIRFGLLPDTMGRELAQASVNSFRTLGYVMLVMAVTRAFLWWYLTAGGLYILNILLSAKEQAFSRHLSLSVVASTYSFLSDAHLLLVWNVRGADSFRSASELSVPIGLNLIPLGWSPYWYSFMGHVNVYELASLVAAAFGFVRLTGSPRFVSYLSILAAWLSSIALRSLF